MNIRTSSNFLIKLREIYFPCSVLSRSPLRPGTGCDLAALEAPRIAPVVDQHLHKGHWLSVEETDVVVIQEDCRQRIAGRRDDVGATGYDTFRVLGGRCLPTWEEKKIPTDHSNHDSTKKIGRRMSNWTTVCMSNIKTCISFLKRESMKIPVTVCFFFNTFLYCKGYTHRWTEFCINICV